MASGPGLGTGHFDTYPLLLTTLAHCLLFVDGGLNFGMNLISAKREASGCDRSMF